MAQVKPREARRSIMLGATLRADGAWVEVTIANVSSSGLLLKCPFPPRRNSFIEIRHREETIIGRVAWSNGTGCGVRSQDPINVDALLGFKGAHKAVDRRQWTGQDIQVRARQLPSTTAEASQRFGRVINWAVIAVAGGVGAVTVANLVASSLSDPLHKVSATLNRSGNGR